MSKMSIQVAVIHMIMPFLSASGGSNAWEHILHPVNGHRIFVKPGVFESQSQVMSNGFEHADAIILVEVPRGLVEDLQRAYSSERP